jgi:hypothetical protein
LRFKGFKERAQLQTKDEELPRTPVNRFSIKSKNSIDSVEGDGKLRRIFRKLYRAISVKPFVGNAPPRTKANVASYINCSVAAAVLPTVSLWSCTSPSMIVISGTPASAK